MTDKVKGQAPEDQKAQDADQTTTNPQGGDTEPQDGKVFDEAYVKQLREEAAKYRVELKKLKEQQEELTRKQLEEQQKYKELYEKTMKELEQLKPKAEAFEEFKQKQKEELLSKLPDDLKQKYAELDADTALKILPDIVNLATQGQAQNPDPGRAGTQNTGKLWTPEEVAKLSPAEYEKHKQEIFESYKKQGII